MVEQQNKKVPQIRFKGFSEEWEEKAIGEVFCEKRRSIALEDNELYELVTVKRRNGGVVSRGYLKGKDILVKNYSQLKAGDYIISKRQVVHGATGIVPEELNNAIVSNEYLVSVGNENSTAEFLAIISTLPGMYQKFFLSSYGVDIEKLFFDADDWRKRNVVIPQLPEQNKICSYFNVLDRVIGMHQRKHEKLVMLKKAMLTKMFPKNGATTPEIRFKGFSEPWEEKKLMEITSLITKGTTPLSKSGVGSINFVKIENINGLSGGITITSKISKEEHAGYLKRSQLKKDDILFSIAGTLGRVAVVKEKILPANTNQALAIIRLSKGNIGYVTTFLKGKAIEDFIRKNPTIGAQSNLSLEQIGDLKILLPSKGEQEKIGTYFRQLDELIEQHRAQVDKLKQLKTACLEKMFV